MGARWWQGGRPSAAIPLETAPDLRARLADFARQASGLGRRAADLAGAIDDASARSQARAGDCAALSDETASMLTANRAIGSATEASLASVAGARAAVDAVGEGVAGARATLDQVSGAAAEIGRIAMQTRLVAFNAAVEARHAGEAGRGFAVVAEAVKQLAARVEQSSRSIEGTVAQLGERIDALARELRSDAPAGASAARADGDGVGRSGFEAALRAAEQGVAEIAEAARRNAEACGRVAEGVGRMATQMADEARGMQAARGMAGGFLQVSEALIELVADSGIDTEDTPYIAAVGETARAIERLFEAELAAGRITLDALFDEDYRAVPGSEPAQFTTRFTGLVDRLLPPFQEPMLERLPKVVWCAAVDRNGYLPAHNRQFSQPQRPGEIAWNTAYSRNRRVFDDRTGLAAARNERPFLLQTYRRDMGGGRFVTMKDLSVPIRVAGRHWGALRLGYGF